jgi:alpha-glucosidase
MSDFKWWQRAVFYQIYPRSFADGNGDGVGDLAGVISKLDYLKGLGIDAIWLSPHYPSPQYDCGYDISDYTGVDPEYGTLEDFKSFLYGAHKRDIRVILDLVLNHTSDAHSWFLESRSDLNNPKRDWYIWRPGVNGGPPNNWVSTFGGPAWEFDPQTGEYYYHFFFKQQPDLNWRNPEVKKAMFDAVRFWLDMGVDGFRLDAIGTIYEDSELPNHEVPLTLAELRSTFVTARDKEELQQAENMWKNLFKYQVDQPGLHELLKELRSVVDEYEDRVLVGETDEIVYHGSGDDELHMVFNFPLMRTERINPTWIRQNQDTRLAELAEISPHCWPCNTLGNHDTPRVYNRFGDGINDAQIAKLSLGLMLTLKGTPFFYNGDEIGMTDLILEDINQFRDMLGVWLYQAEINELGKSPEEALKTAAQLTRDKNRTPFQWENSENGGFSPPGLETWLPVHPNHALGVNVADQDKDPGSLLNFYRRMIVMRKLHPALVEGEYDYLSDNRTEHERTGTEDFYFAFLRKAKNQVCLVVLNFSDHSHSIDFKFIIERSQPGVVPKTRLVFSSWEREAEIDDLSEIVINPFEIYIGELARK